MFQQLGRFLIIFGVVLIVIGVLLTYSQYIGKIPFIGRFPGDIYIRKGNFVFYFPIVTCILISIILTIILNIFSKK